MESNKSAALASSSTGIICDVRLRRSAGEHRTRLTSANQRLRRHWPPDAMPRWCCEFVDSRLRRSPPDRASAVPHGQAGENALRFPHLAHRSAAVHKLHSTAATSWIDFDSGKGETFNRLQVLAYSSRNLSKRQRWSTSLRQRFAFDKWISCRLVRSCAVAGRCAGRAEPDRSDDPQRRRNSCRYGQRSVVEVARCGGRASRRECGRNAL